MTNKINLHAHCTWSDGVSSPEDMVKAYKEKNYTVAVLTDHCYTKPSYFNSAYQLFRYENSFLIKPSDYQHRLAMGKALSDKYEIPVIIGVEYMLEFENPMLGEEVVVIGEEANEYILEQRWCRNGKNPTIEDLLTLRSKEIPMLINYCHPAVPTQMARMGMQDILDGFEYIRKGKQFFDTLWCPLIVPEEFSHLHRLSNSDAHSTSALDMNWMEVNGKKITNELDLIESFKRGSSTKIKLINNYMPHVQIYN